MLAEHGSEATSLEKKLSASDVKQGLSVQAKKEGTKIAAKEMRLAPDLRHVTDKPKDGLKPAGQRSN